MDISRYSERKYTIFVGDPSGFRGPKEIESITVVPVVVVHGPESPNWQPADILFELVEPIMYEGQVIKRVTVSPRYEGDSLRDILEKETTVAVGRILAESEVNSDRIYEASAIEYWAIGTIRPNTT